MTTDRIQTQDSPLRCMLTNIGHKRLTERRRDLCPTGPDDELMAELCRQGIVLLSASGLVKRLMEAGWIEEAPAAITVEAARLRYDRNPLQHLERFNFEMTTLCNFNCRHCRNGGIAPHTETDLPLLKQSAETIMSIGIRRFDFIGGEVSRFGTGWLDLAGHITAHDRSLEWQQPLIVTLYTNGWWLEQRDFVAAGKSYADDRAYLRDLREHGVTHILFSIDGPEKLHDQWRGHPGLFRRVFRGLTKVSQAGIKLAEAEALIGANPLVAEAGTGVGKSLAYLVPAARFALETGDVSAHQAGGQVRVFAKCT